MPRKKSKPKQKTPQKIRCAIYTRKSHEEGLELEFNSLDAQRETGEAYIASQQHEGWVCLQTRYNDGGYSGGDMERPALQRLLEDIQAGKVDCVVIYKLDRLSRSLLDFARIMEIFDQHEVSFVSVTQQFNTATSMGRLMLNILLSFAQFEREIIGERIRDKIAAQRRKGKWAGGIPVLGYDVDRSGHSPKLVINATEAARVREIFDLYRRHGSLLAVVEELERRGWTNKEWLTRKGHRRGGRPFEKSSLHALLTNPIYAGRVKHNTEFFEGEHEAIIPKEAFREVQARLKQNNRTGGAEVRNKHAALLKGRLVCKACERAMVHTFTARGRKRYRYYTCSRAIQSGYQTCPSPSLRAPEIESVVVDQIRCIATDRKLKAEVLRQAESYAKEELARLRLERTQLERELSRHHREIRQAVTNPDGIATTLISDLQNRISEAERRMPELAEEIAAAENDQLTKEDVDAAFGDFDNLWDALSPREQSQLVGLLISQVGFDPEDSSIEMEFHPTAIKKLAQQMGVTA